MENLGPSSSQKTIENIFPWQRAWQTLKAIWPQLVYISLVSMSIPQYLLFGISTRKAAELSEAFQIKQLISFENALIVLKNFLIQYLGVGAIVSVLFLLGCFTIVALCLQTARAEPIHVASAVKKAVSTLVPKGITLLLSGLLLSLFLLNIAAQILPGQVIHFLGLVACVLLSALPVLMVLEAKRPILAFKNAMTLDYVGLTGMSKWSAFFLLLTYELLALNSIALFEWLGSYVQDIDVYLSLSRNVVFQTSALFPFGKLIWLTEAIYSVGFAFTTMAFLVLNTSFVYELYRRNTLGRTIAVEA